MEMEKYQSVITTWTNTHWLVKEVFHLQPTLESIQAWEKDGREIIMVELDTVISVICEPQFHKGHEKDRIANFDFVKVLYKNQIWCVYCHRIFGGCEELT